MVKQEVTFRDFDKTDWMDFNGCESKTPKISNDFVFEDGSSSTDSLCIIDGLVVELYLGDPADCVIRNFQCLKLFETELEAKLVELLSNMTCDQDLLDAGFTKGGVER